jgi:hypothetical protein
MNYYKSNTNEYYAAERLIDALESAKSDHPKAVIFILPIESKSIPDGAIINYTH